MTPAHAIKSVKRLVASAHDRALDIVGLIDYMMGECMDVSQVFERRFDIWLLGLINASTSVRLYCILYLDYYTLD